MAEENKTHSILNSTFLDLVEKTPVNIPKIQRDYAQGRENEVAKEIRTGFVHDLMQAIKHGTEKQLDFVYGSYQDGKFEPLDGQQRLTTLFLLHWYFDVTLHSVLENGKIVPYLSYETRSSAEDFCRELVQHEAKQFREAVTSHKNAKDKRVSSAQERVDEAKNKIRELGGKSDAAAVKELQKELELAKEELQNAKGVPDLSISSLIRNRDWFSYLWKFDPTIQSMLVMIDSIHDEAVASNVDTVLLKENLNHITFSRLNLGDFGLSDELFIKMNARGKLLSGFDILKSTIEEEIQVQKSEDRCTIQIEEKWRSMIDGEWIDWFWNQYAANGITEITESDEDYAKRLALAKNAEENLKRLILRVISLQQLVYNSDWDDLAKACYDDTADSLEGLMSKYNDKFRTIRHKQDASPLMLESEIRFDEVIKDISSLYYKTSVGTYRTIFSLIAEKYNVYHDSQEKDYLSIMIDDSVANDCKVIFYALLGYSRAFPIPDNTEPDQVWISNFNEWAHFCRNVFLNFNNNTRIDKPSRFMDAVKAVKVIIGDLQESVNERGGSIVADSVRSFIAGLGSKTYIGIENGSLKEEIKKAELKQNDSRWVDCIDKAECIPYLWGQIRCLIKWADDDLDAFNEYADRFRSIINIDEYLFYAGVLSNDPNFGFERGSFCEFNRDRDNSIKRYLRDVDNAGMYAVAIKTTLDNWIRKYPDHSADEYLEASVCEALKSESRTYRRCILVMPSILEDSSNRKIILSHKGHYILAQKKTINSHCYDLALRYIYYRIENDGKFKSVLFFDSFAETYQHAISFEIRNKHVLIRQADEGRYTLSVDGEITEFVNETELLDHMFDHYSIC